MLRTRLSLRLEGFAPSWEVGGLPPDGPLWGVATKGITVSGVTWLHFSFGE